MNLIRVSIVEDDERVRKSLAALIERSGFCELVSAYGSAEEALKELVLNSPDVLLMDIHLPGISGVECVNRLRAIDFKGSRPEIVMLTVYEESQNIFDALQAGATGYLLKRAGSEEILEAIRSVRQGGAPMSSHIARKVVQSFRRLPLSPQTQHSDSESLSKREEEVLSLVAQGYINKEIADMTGLSVETVRSYLKNIYKKLHVRSRTAAAMKYFS
jgi:DNA-binding NarL/FixJ family response regulator